MPISNYKSERINNRTSIFKKWLIFSAIISIPILIDFIFPGWLNFIQKDRPFWYFMAIVFSLQELIKLFQEDAVNEIIIDTSMRHIQIQYYDSNYGQVSKTMTFDNLQIKSIRLIWFKNGHVSSIYFFTTKNKMYEITKWKDGFSRETLNRLSDNLQSLTSPIK